MFMTAPAMWVLKRLGLRGKFALVSVLGLGSMAGAGWAVQALPTLPALGVVLGAGALFLYVLWAFQAVLMQQLGQLSRAMAQATAGDLTVRVEAQGRDELAQMAQLLDKMVIALSSMVADVLSNAALVSHTGATLLQDNHLLAERTDQQCGANRGQRGANHRRRAKQCPGCHRRPAADTTRALQHGCGRGGDGQGRQFCRIH